MRVYYDENGAILYTMNGDPNTMPDGDYIEVPADTETRGHIVVDGQLVHSLEIQADENILAAPTMGFGGASMKEAFDGNR